MCPHHVEFHTSHGSSPLVAPNGPLGKLFPGSWRTTFRSCGAVTSGVVPALGGSVGTGAQAFRGPFVDEVAAEPAHEVALRFSIGRVLIHDRHHRRGHQRPGSHSELDDRRVSVGAPRVPCAGNASSSATTSATVPEYCQSGSPCG